MSLLLPFFKGNSLESEFGFVNCYHSHPINRLLHTLAIPLQIFGVLTIASSIDYRLSLFFYIFYCAIIFLFDYKTAISYIILFGILYGPAIIFSSQGTRSIFYGLVIIFTGLIMQEFGHYKFQPSAGGFHLFSTIFTTPVFLMMYLITDHDKPFWNNVKKETNKWKQLLNK
jgi:uncharacterized membrane protein YGL010W